MANENMIQKHEDNFLAKIAGETPIDDNPRNSTEFWLKEIAGIIPDNLGKKLYYHPIVGWSKNAAGRTLAFSCVIVNSSPTPFATLEALHTWCVQNEITFLAPVSGYIYNTDASKGVVLAWVDVGSNYFNFRGAYTDDSTVVLRDGYVYVSNMSNYNIDDKVNRIL